MKKKHISKDMKIVLLLVAIIAAYFIFNIVRIRVYKSNIEAQTSMGFEVADEAARLEELKAIDSDIEGMSQYDKYEMGLSIEDGSDSDSDGLTDKEEIEIYDSDPLKASTAGDLYTDGYKVANGMELQKSYPYEGEKVYPNNSCENVLLKAVEPTDFNAVVTDVTGEYDVSDYGVTEYQGYKIYNYAGNMTINLQGLYDERNITSKDVNTYIYEGVFFDDRLGELNRCDFTADGDTITLDSSFDKDKTYYIFVTNKRTVAATLRSKLNLTNEDHVDDEYVAVMYGCPLVVWLSWGHLGTRVVYSGTDNADETATFKSGIIQFFENTSILEEDMLKHSTTVQLDEKAAVKGVYKILQCIMPTFEYGYNEDSTSTTWVKNNFHKLFFMYTYVTKSDLNKIAANGIDGENGDKTTKYVSKSYHTEFDPYTDELAFQNFESDYGPTGNCTGIAHLTSYLYNTKSYPSEGTYNDISWNLTTDEENATLMDPGLYDYKDIHFIDNHSEKGSDRINNITAGEQEFVKMIGSAFQEANDRISIDDYTKYNGDKYDYALAEKMMAYIDQDKILDVYMLFNNGMGHAVNVYDYYLNTRGEIVFKVYDSNIPQNDRSNYDMEEEGAAYLQVCKVIREDGTEGMDFLYYPTKYNASYLATSDINLMQQSSMVVVDENWNVLN